MTSASPPPKHTQLPHPLNQRSPEARAPQYPITESPAFSSSRAQPLPRSLPAPPISKHATDSAALDAATAAIIKAGDNLDVGDTGLLNDLCERLSNTELYTRPITRQRIIELLEVASDEMAKTRAAGLWEITARVAQERHFVCPPQMEGTVKCYIKLIDTVNENSAAFDEEDLKARLVRVNQSKPFQANIPANTACLFCRRRKIKCDGSLPQCDMCLKHRQAKCEYPQKSHYGGFSNRGGVHYVVPMGPDIAAAAACSANGAPPPMLLELGKAVKGYAPPPIAAPAYILPGPAPTGYESEQASRSRQDIHRRGSFASSTGYDARNNQAGSNMSPPARRNSSATARPEGNGDKSWDGYPDEEEEDSRPMSSTSSQILQDVRAPHVEMEDGEAPRRRSPHTGNERCINCDTDKTSLWRKDEDGRTICNACQIYFRVHGRKRPPSMRSSTVKKRPGRQPRPSAGHTLPHDVYVSDYAPTMQSPHSSGSHSPPTEYLHHQQHQLRVIEQAIANGQRTQPPNTAGLDYALNREGYRGRAADYVSPQDHPISPGPRNSYNRDARAPLHPSPSVDMSLADATEDRHRGRRTSDEHRRAPEDDDETEVQAGENLCAVEGGRSPADVLVFRFDADRAKSVCATQWAHLRSPGRTVEDDLRFHLNCYRKNPPDSSSQERVTLGVATDWLPKAGVYSITSGDEPPTSHHMAPPPNGKLNQTIDITSEIREGLNTLKFTQLRDMSDCVLVVQIWKVGRKSAGPQAPPAQAGRYGNVMSPVDKHHHSRAPPSTASRGPPVYEASPSPGTGVPPRGASPSRGSRSKTADANLKPGAMRRHPCVYCYNNRLACRVAWQPEAGCEECARRNIECLIESPSDGYHAPPADRKPALHSPPAYPHSSAPLSPGGSSSGSKRKPVDDQNGSNKSKRITYSRSKKPGETTPPPAQTPSTLPPMHHIQHVPAPPPTNYPASAAAPGANPNRGSVVDARANQDLRRHQEMLAKQQQDAERESQRVLAGGLPTPYA
ncbi:unnamed protein product [Rhizoctonia solani]|uniref:Uncharacterized protein n=1 Tax=Rhizoctonia solani TaxID=456999 RepID=A0A8H2XJY8_9AGAM|nr:unnamed protein product [Rhizoctonia solani]